MIDEVTGISSDFDTRLESLFGRELCSDAYIADGFIGGGSLSRVQLPVAIFVEHFGKDEIAIADDSIPIEVETYVW